MRGRTWGLVGLLGVLVGYGLTVWQAPIEPVLDRPAGSWVGVEDIDAVAFSLGCEETGRAGQPASDALTRLSVCVKEYLRVMDTHVRTQAETIDSLRLDVARPRRREADDRAYYRMLGRHGLVPVVGSQRFDLLRGPLP